MSAATVEVVADTQVLIWYVLEPERLTSRAVAALEAETAAGRPIGVSAWSITELAYAVEKTTNPLTEEDRQAIIEELRADDSPFEVLPVTLEVAARIRRVPRTHTPDPGDRAIVATGASARRGTRRRCGGCGCPERAR